MTKPLFLSCLITFFLFLYISPSNSDELKKEEFSIMLPDDWVDIPREVIDDYLKNLAELAPDAPKHNYDYGFQSKYSDEWFEYPYLLIQINNKGRISELQLEKLEEIPIQENIDAHKEKLKAILSDIEMGKMIYDKNAGIIWMRVELKVVNSGSVSGLLGMIPTEKGFINVIGYSHSLDFQDFEPLFQTVAMSVSPNPKLAYRIRKWERFLSFLSRVNWEEVKGKAITAGLIAGLIFLAASAGRKKKKKRFFV